MPLADASSFACAWAFAIAWSIAASFSSSDISSLMIEFAFIALFPFCLSFYYVRLYCFCLWNSVLTQSIDTP